MFKIILPMLLSFLVIDGPNILFLISVSSGWVSEKRSWSISLSDIYIKICRYTGTYVTNIFFILSRLLKYCRFSFLLVENFLEMVKVCQNMLAHVQDFFKYACLSIVLQVLVVIGDVNPCYMFATYTKEM